MLARAKILYQNIYCMKCCLFLLVSQVLLINVLLKFSWSVQPKTLRKNWNNRTEFNVCVCDEIDVKNIDQLENNTKKFIDITEDNEVERITSSGCWNIINYYSFDVAASQFTKEEKDYPIAYSIVAHKNAQQLILLLSQIYTPHNLYCIHLDTKAPVKMYKALEHVQDCFPNIRLTLKREYVVYASFSRLQADINCMMDLLRASIPWKHLINLSGQDFPIKTNFEIVRILKTLNGRNAIPGDATPNKFNIGRTKYVHRVNRVTSENGSLLHEEIVATTELKFPPPFNITIRKNLAYNVFSRKFLYWALVKSEKGKALLEWSRDTCTPDEHFWLMLDALEEAPGRTGTINWRTITPHVVWKSKTHKCAGYWNHYSCVFGFSDLPELQRQNKLFANKFDIQDDARTIFCLRKWLNKRKVVPSDYAEY